MMQQCEGVLLGRAPVDGTVNASSLATLIRTLLASRERLSRSVGSVYSERRRFTLRCRDCIEIIPSKTPSSSAARPRRVEDEGFESDDDNSSTKSAASIDDTISTSSSCCFVDDHVFKFPTKSSSSSRGVANSTSSTSSVATDSANSSGASDTDEIETSASPSPSSTTGTVSKLVQSLTLFQRGGTNKDNETTDSKVNESYPVADVAFCHTDPAFPKIIVWVVKKRRLQRLTNTGADNGASGLEAIVFECLNERGLKRIQSSYQEISRRAKLDQYRHPHRRKDLFPSNAAATRNDLSPSNASPTRKDLFPSNPTPTRNDLSPSNATPTPYTLSLLKQTEKEIPKTTTVYTSSPATDVTDYIPKGVTTIHKTYHDKNDVAKTYSNNYPEVTVAKTYYSVPPKTLPKPSRSDSEGISLSSKYNLVHRTDGDGVTHIEVARGTVQSSILVDSTNDSGVPSSIISINTPDVGNILSPSSAATQKSKLCKEIEGVIRSDIDNSGGIRREPTNRQREPAILVMNGVSTEDPGSELHKVWNPPKEEEEEQEEEDEDQLDVVVSEHQPPQRPERRKYAKKKAPAPQPPVSPRPSPDLVIENSKRLHIPSRPEIFMKNQQNNQQKIVRGQFIRVNVDQPQQQQQPVVMPMARSTSPWVLSNANGSSKMVAYSSPSWIPLSPPLKTNKEPSKHIHRRVLDDLFTLHSTGQQKHHRRSRSTGGGNSRSRSPPATRRPMAYRYIDVGNTPPPLNHTNTLSNRFFGLSQKLRDLGGNSAMQGYPYATTGRRRIGDDEGQFSSSEYKGNLKSVIKKGKRAGEYVEPKKVTFSAYATVQVVD